MQRALLSPDADIATLLSSLAAEVERRPDNVLPQLLALADRAAAARAFPEALESLLLAERAAYAAERLGEARQVGARAVELARQTGDVLGEAEAYRWLALVAFDDGRSKDGHDHLLDAMAAFEDAGHAAEVPGLMRIYGEHLAVLGALVEAEQALRQARERYLALGDLTAAASVAADLRALAERQ